MGTSTGAARMAPPAYRPGHTTVFRTPQKSLSNVLICCVQDDLLYETLTVHETLYYAAMLRLPSTMSAAQKCERVENVILSLGLDKCRDTIVGACPFYILCAPLYSQRHPSS
jgi:ABC-type multidrug transport system ATPase subunit